MKDVIANYALTRSKLDICNPTVFFVQNQFQRRYCLLDFRGCFPQDVESAFGIACVKCACFGIGAKNRAGEGTPNDFSLLNVCGNGKGTRVAERLCPILILFTQKNLSDFVVQKPIFATAYRCRHAVENERPNTVFPGVVVTIRVPIQGVISIWYIPTAISGFRAVIRVVGDRRDIIFICFGIRYRAG